MIAYNELTYETRVNNIKTTKKVYHSLSDDIKIRITLEDLEAKYA